ncbi:MAG TPA: response regulator [Micropepsaceae bacterium]|nr:response regulator [Micropepsaceae bacterium]
MSGLNNCVLVVDDEFLIAMGFRTQVEDMGLTVCGTAATADDAIALSQKHRPAVVLMDMRLGGDKDGVDAAMVIHDTVGSKVIFITGSRDPATIERINGDHPFALLFKPVSNRQLRATIADAMRQ